MLCTGCTKGGTTSHVTCESHAKRHASRVKIHMSHVTCHTSHVTRKTCHTSRCPLLVACARDVLQHGLRTSHTSNFTRHTSHATRQTSHVTRHTPHVTRHTSHVMHKTSHVTRHTQHAHPPAADAAVLRILFRSAQAAPARVNVSCV